MENPQARLAKSTEMIRQLLEALPVEAIIQYREQMVKLQAQQLILVDEILKKKGHGIDNPV